ncbi:hypothetical protein D7X88_08765 [bacterium C-53]|nr:hypothetical protein [Lachnospiraceae bacterium]NBI03129.1 hypothetical protein [Lachnospiraceae bacterium]RKJ10023.1 hypothetical protein D7X88_08765 [bacterium C-53]
MKLKNGKLMIDLMNLFLGIGTIVLAVVLLSGEPLNRNLFPVVFALGAAMLSLNAARFYQEHRMISVVFAVLSIAVALLLIFSLLQLAF